jgi:phosphoheptose isomerase
MSTTTPAVTTPTDTGPPGALFVDTDLAADLATAALDVARKFHDGATLWVIAPQWEPHAHHVAVEFVHPVIVGKRALPSVALVEPDPVAQARVASQPGDLLLAVASADEPSVIDAMRRAAAWGVSTVWIGSGPPQAPHITSCGSTQMIRWCRQPGGSS